MSGDQTPQGSLLYIHAITALHPGSGHALGVVDLPVQRERHTQWPLIPASSVKGVLRDACRAATGAPTKDADNHDDVVAAFGPANSNADAHAGALLMTDARLLAFPVRSLAGVFAWITCPAALERLSRDLRLAGKSELPGLAGIAQALGAEKDHNAILAAGSPLVISGQKSCVVLEEFEFTPHKDKLPDDVLKAVQAAADKASEARVSSSLVILHDDHFTHFVRHATEVTARIALEYDKKTAKGGALFYQEFLPAESLFYAVVMANPSRSGKAKSAADIKGVLKTGINKQRGMLQFGGNETIGRGFCVVRLSE